MRKRVHSLWNARAAASGSNRAADRRGERRRADRRRVVLALRLTAALAAVMVTATTASSTAQQAPDIPVSISAQLGSGSGPLLMEIDGHQNPPKSSRYAITGSLRAIPCPGKTYHFVIAATVGRARATYDAMMVLRRSGGDRIPCGTTLPRSLGRTFLRLQVYRKGSTPGNSAITVKGNRRNSAFKGTMSIGNLVCRDSHWLRVQLSGPSGPLSLVYEMNLKKVSIYGRPCS
jgi:hypothetical protein